MPFVDRLNLHAQSLRIEKFAMGEDRAVLFEMSGQGGETLPCGRVIDQSAPVAPEEEELEEEEA